MLSPKKFLKRPLKLTGTKNNEMNSTNRFFYGFFS